MYIIFMSENVIDINPETVYWINGRKYGRIERIIKWLYELSGQGAYVSKERMPFATAIPVADIDSLPNKHLKSALRRQLGNVANNDPTVIIPVATMDGSASMLVTIVARNNRLPSEYTLEENEEQEQ